MEKVAKKFQKYSCTFCNIICSKESNWNKHLSTNKHKKRLLSNENQQTATKLEHILICSNCNKTYKDRTGLWRHSKKCNKVEIISIQITRIFKEIIKINLKILKIKMNNHKSFKKLISLKIKIIFKNLNK